MLGFGASITDASAWLIQHRMSPTQRDALLRELFGREGDGIGFGFTRLTIGASDFSGITTAWTTYRRASPIRNLQSSASRPTAAT